MVVRLRLVRGADIASWPVAAIAVSSNLTLAPNNNPHYWRFAGRTGTNGAVHDAAGPELLAAVRRLPVLHDESESKSAAAVGIAGSARNTRCQVSRAVSTPAFGSLPCEYVIHAVAPDGMYGFERDSETQLRETYRAVLTECARLRCKSLAMPAIGCGVQGWRPVFAARAAMAALETHNASPWGGIPSEVDLVFNSESAWRGFRAVAQKHLGPPVTTEMDGYDDEIALWRLHLPRADSKL